MKSPHPTKAGGTANYAVEMLDIPRLMRIVWTWRSSLHRLHHAQNTLKKQYLNPKSQCFEAKVADVESGVIDHPLSPAYAQRERLRLYNRSLFVYSKRTSFWSRLTFAVKILGKWSVDRHPSPTNEMGLINQMNSLSINRAWRVACWVLLMAVSGSKYLWRITSTE